MNTSLPKATLRSSTRPRRSICLLAPVSAIDVREAKVRALAEEQFGETYPFYWLDGHLGRLCRERWRGFGFDDFFALSPSGDGRSVEVSWLRRQDADSPLG